MHLTRRGLICSALALAVPRPARAAPVLQRRLAFENLHTGETVSAVYWEQGRYAPYALQAIDHVLRDFRTGEVHPIAPPLLDLLASLQRTLGTDGPFQIISGYRSPATNSLLQKTGGGGVATRSFHTRGMAIDVRVPGVALTDLRDAALNLKRGGVGFYPREDFVHVDIGPVRRWG